MATKKPPTNAIDTNARSPRASSLGDLLSNIESLFESLEAAGLMLAPAKPDSELVSRAARETGITDKQALRSYRIISTFGETTTH